MFTFLEACMLYLIILATIGVIMKGYQLIALPNN